MSPTKRKSSSDGKTGNSSSPSNIPLFRGLSLKSNASQLSRTDSSQSLLSHFAECPEDEAPMAQIMADVFAKGRRILKTLRTVVKNKSTPESKTLDRLETMLQKITKKDIVMQKTYYEQKEHFSQVIGQNQLLQEELREHLQTLESKILAPEQIADSVREVIVDQTTKAHLLELANPAVSSTEASSTQLAEDVPSYSEKLQQIKRKTLPDHPSKRTLIIRGREGETGQKLNEIIRRSKYSTQLSLEKILHKPNCLEVICKSEADLDVLQTDMQEDSCLNRDLMFVKKPIPYERMILLNVPTELDADELRSSVKAEYNISEQDMVIQREQLKNTPAETKNYILLMPKQLAQTIIDRGDSPSISQPIDYVHTQPSLAARTVSSIIT